jgi:23S rRNA (cytidine1920-2'-O)/16S rRNA (cytidine1409-2'-O)-methyltransferase
VADALLSFAVAGGDLVVLVKPQFEAARAEVDRGPGVVVDPEVWARVLAEVIAALRERGATIMGVMASPITGSDGNVEFVLHAVAPGDDRRRPEPPGADADQQRIDAAVREATTG